MKLSVQNISDDGLRQRVWEFSLSNEKIRLTRYAVQTRESKRHGWKGPFWDSADERNYHSKLPRPTDIPLWVRAEAVNQIKYTFYIGWLNEESRLETDIQRDQRSDYEKA